MTEKCKHCGNIHEARCPWVKSIEYFEDGTIKRVEYMTPADYAMPYGYIPYPVPQPYPVYPQPYYMQPLIPYYHNPVTCGSHSTLYNS